MACVKKMKIINHTYNILILIINLLPESLDGTGNERTHSLQHLSARVGSTFALVLPEKFYLIANN